jgi:hypothetical protein
MAQQAQIHSRCRDLSEVLDVPQIAKPVVARRIRYGPGPRELLASIEQVAWPAVPVPNRGAAAGGIGKCPHLPHGDKMAFVELPDSLPLGPLRNLIDLALILTFSGHSLLRCALRQQFLDGPYRCACHAENSARLRRLRDGRGFCHSSTVLVRANPAQPGGECLHLRVAASQAGCDLGLACDLRIDGGNRLLRLGLGAETVGKFAPRLVGCEAP